MLRRLLNVLLEAYDGAVVLRDLRYALLVVRNDGVNVASEVLMNGTLRILNSYLNEGL